MKLEIDPELKELLSRQVQPGNTKRTNTSNPSKHRKHNHFPTGKQGYVPQGAGQNPYSRHWRR